MMYPRLFRISRVGLVLLSFTIGAVRRAVRVAVVASAVAAIAIHGTQYATKTGLLGAAPVFLVPQIEIFLSIHDAATAPVCNCGALTARRRIPGVFSHAQIDVVVAFDVFVTIAFQSAPLAELVALCSGIVSDSGVERARLGLVEEGSPDSQLLLKKQAVANKMGQG